MQPQLPEFLCMSWEWFFYMIYLNLSVISLPPFPKLNTCKKVSFSKKHLGKGVLNPWDKNLNFWYTFSHKIIFRWSKNQPYLLMETRYFFPTNFHSHVSLGYLYKKLAHTQTKKTSKTKQKNPKQTNKNTDYMEQVESMSLDFRIQMKGIVLLRWS